MTRILLADDNIHIGQVASRLLEGAGFEVQVFETGEALLAAVPHSRPDLIICDLFMPDTDGLEVIQTIRREDPTLKIIAMSGGAFQGVLNMLETARLLGATAILDKPFSRME